MELSKLSFYFVDPVFSTRCSPSQLFGPKRYRDPPLKISELPKIDAVVISHTHYDHLDCNSVKELNSRFVIIVRAAEWKQLHYQKINWVPKYSEFILYQTTIAVTFDICFWYFWQIWIWVTLVCPTWCQKLDGSLWLQISKRIRLVGRSQNKRERRRDICVRTSTTLVQENSPGRKQSRHLVLKLETMYIRIRKE